LEDTHLIEPMVRAYHPGWIIHAAANTDLDACERDPAAARLLHVTATAELARAARVCGCRLLHVSTDAVYDGDRTGAHLESDPTHPINVYAQTKLEGEQACLRELPAAVVARVNFFGFNPARPGGLASWILGRFEAGQEIPGFTNVHFSPLYCPDLADLIRDAIACDLPGGTFNFGAADGCSKYEFARRLVSHLGGDPGLVRPAPLAAAALRTPRPRNTVMSSDRLAAALGRSLPSIEDGLQRFVRQLRTDRPGSGARPTA
jgi:dTDP-4-dehydrorhamnose reductase